MNDDQNKLRWKTFFSKYAIFIFVQRVGDQNEKDVEKTSFEMEIIPLVLKGIRNSS